MSTNNTSTNQFQSQSSSSQNGSQSGKIKDKSSRIRSIDPADTTFARFDGGLPKKN